MPRLNKRRTAMTSHRTSPLRLAAAIVGLMAVVNAGPGLSQDIPEVRPRSEVFGNLRHIGWKEDDLTSTPPPEPITSNAVFPENHRSAKSPFSVVEPEWQAVGATPPRRLPVAGQLSEAFPKAISNEPEPG